MNDDEALAICGEWIRYLERQKAKAEEMSRLATLARSGPEGAAEAKRKLRQIDKQPTVYDGARLEPAVRHLMARVSDSQFHAQNDTK